MKLSFLAILLCAPVLAAQATAPVAPSERIPNLDKLKQQLRAYHDCTRAAVCYRHDLDMEANRAIAFLTRRAARARAGEKLAIVLDIDETSLTNYEEMQAGDFGWDQTRFNTWVDAAKAPAIPGTLRLAQTAQRLGVSVFFITGRPESQRAATETNLRAAGYENWQQLFLRGESELKTPTIAYKSAARERIVEQGYRIVLSVGDQWSDLRGRPAAEFSVKYPDPFYYIP